MTRSADYDDKTDESPRPATATNRGVAPELKPNEARGAVTHHNARTVLAVSCGLIVIAFVIVYVAFFAGAPPQPG
jgi:hypothetical protein